MKSRHKEESTVDFGGFMIVDSSTGFILAGGGPHGFSLTLDEVENFLAARPRQKRK